MQRHTPLTGSDSSSLICFQSNEMEAEAASDDDFQNESVFRCRTATVKKQKVKTKVSARLCREAVILFSLVSFIFLLPCHHMH